MDTNLTIASGSSETGALLRDYLIERGIYNDHSKAVVCYGDSHGRHAYRLNENCVTDKVSRMITIDDAGGNMIPWFSSHNTPDNVEFPLLARKRYGHGGTDIVPVFQQEEIPWRIQSGFDWFSQYIPVMTEYRVWIYRGQHLDTYEKVMTRPRDFKYVGRNFRNGFDFIHRSPIDEASEQAALAVKALQLDFAAVDLLHGLDGNIYILEVNTAPGVLASKAERTLGKLADHIQGWVSSGYPERSY